MVLLNTISAVWISALVFSPLKLSIPSTEVLITAPLAARYLLQDSKEPHCMHRCTIHSYNQSRSCTVTHGLCVSHCTPLLTAPPSLLNQPSYLDRFLEDHWPGGLPDIICCTVRILQEQLVGQHMLGGPPNPHSPYRDDVHTIMFIVHFCSLSNWPTSPSSGKPFIIHSLILLAKSSLSTLPLFSTILSNMSNICMGEQNITSCDLHVTNMQCNNGYYNYRALVAAIIKWPSLLTPPPKITYKGLK